MNRLHDGDVVDIGGREFIAIDEPPDEDGHGFRGWECVRCEVTFGGGEDAVADHDCGRQCPECDQWGAEVTVRTYDGVTYRTWNCCGEDVHCPGCGAEAAQSLRYDDRVGAYCTRCSWSAS